MVCCSDINKTHITRDADKSLAGPGSKQAR